MQRKRIPPEKNPAKKMAKNMSIFAFMTCLIIIGVVFLYYNHKQEVDVGGTAKKASEVEILSTKDMELSYPETPVEVMKLFGRFNQCIYNTAADMSDEEFDRLLNQMRVIYSSKLLEQNSFDEQKDSLKSEIQEFSKMKRKIVNYTVEKSSSVQYEKIENQECAYLQMAFFMSENGNYSKSFQDYVLVKEGKQWKILAFKKNTEAKNSKIDKE